MASASTIPFHDLRPRFAAHEADFRAAFDRVMTRGRYVLGPEVEAFETEFAEQFGGGQAVGVANGTDAIELALRAAGIGAGDEVLTVALTAVATACAIVRAGARPVFVDVRHDDYTIDPRQIVDLITPRTQAIVAVHLYGQPAKLQELRGIADRNKLLLIEDCAQAHGAKVMGRPVGTFGHISAFSFYPTKNLGAFGDGGAVLTHDTMLADRVRRLRNYGQTDRYFHVDAGGFNSRLDELQAAMLRVSLKGLAADNAERQRLAERYFARLRLPDLPIARPDTEHVYHLFVVRHGRRNWFQEGLRRRGVETLIHYPVPVHLQPAYRQFGGQVGDLPETEKACREILSLPLYPGLTNAQQDAIIAAANAAAIAEPEAVERLDAKHVPAGPRGIGHRVAVGGAR